MLMDLKLQVFFQTIYLLFTTCYVFRLFRQTLSGTGIKIPRLCLQDGSGGAKTRRRFWTIKYTCIFEVHRAVNRNSVSIVKPTRCTNVSNLLYFAMTLYMFRAIFPSIISSSRLYIQQQTFVKQIVLSACSKQTAVECHSKIKQS